MALNEVFRDADHLSLPVPTGMLPGSPVRVGGLNGVTQTKEGEGGNAVGSATVWLKGAHTFTVAFAAASIGLPIYITAGNVLSEVAAGNSLYGHALSTKTAPAGPLVVRIAN